MEVVDHDTPVEITINNNESVWIFWGGDNQVVPAEVQTLLGVESNLPGVAFLWFAPKRLGQANTWPTIRVEYTRLPYAADGIITVPPQSYPDVFGDSEETFEIQNGADLGGSPHRTRIWLRGWMLDLISSVSNVKITGTSWDGTYAVEETEFVNRISRNMDIERDLSLWGTENAITGSQMGGDIQTFTYDLDPLTAASVELFDRDFIAGPAQEQCLQRFTVTLLETPVGESYQIRLSLDEQNGPEVAWVDLLVQEGTAAVVEASSGATDIETTFEPFNTLVGEATTEVSFSVGGPFAIRGTPRAIKMTLKGGGDGPVRVLKEAEFFRLRESEGTRVILEDTTPGFAANTGTAIPQILEQAFGLNAAHALYHLMFAPAPAGMGLETFYWDIASLQTVGVSLGGDIRLNFKKHSNQDLEKLLEDILTDLGIATPLDPVTGNYKFLLVRESNLVTTLPEHTIGAPTPVSASKEGEKEAPTLDFIFRDRIYDHRDQPLSIASDGSIQWGNRQGAQQVRIESVTDLNSAAEIVSRRRAILEFRTTASKVEILKEGKALLPGMPVSVPTHTERQRITKLKPSTNGAPTRMEIALDTYGVSRPIILPGNRGTTPGLVPPTEDALWILWEAPRQIVNLEALVSILRVPGNAYVQGAEVEVSLSGSNYQEAADIRATVVGGTLLDGILMDGDEVHPEGTRIQLLGSPNLNQILDLSGDEATWRSGLQSCLIVEGDKEELFALESAQVTNLSELTLGRMIRRQLATTQQKFTTAAQVFIFQLINIPRVSHPYIAPDNNIDVRTIPYTSRFLDPLLATPKNYTLKGKWVTPGRPYNLQNESGAQWYKRDPSSPAGPLLSLTWSWFSATSLVYRSGAGTQVAGAAAGLSPPDGSFTFEFSDPAQPLLDPYILTGITDITRPLEVDETEISTKFGGFPAQLDIECYCVEAGRESARTSISLTYLT